MFACEHEGVTPDLFCIAKGLTGGYLPMAATLATGEIYEAFLGDHAFRADLLPGHTYGGNPLAAAAAMATLDVFEEEHTLEELQPKNLARLRELPRAAGRACRMSATFVNAGLIAGIELVRNKESREPYPLADRIGHRVCGSSPFIMAFCFARSLT